MGEITRGQLVVLVILTKTNFLKIPMYLGEASDNMRSWYQMREVKSRGVCGNRNNDDEGCNCPKGHNGPCCFVPDLEEQVRLLEYGTLAFNTPIHDDPDGDSVSLMVVAWSEVTGMYVRLREEN